MKALKLFPLFLAAVFTVSTAQTCKKLAPETPQDETEQQAEAPEAESVVPTENASESQPESPAATSSGTPAAMPSRNERLDAVRANRGGICTEARDEIRGVWVSTVEELDWPMGRYDEQSQKELFREYLDVFEKLNINAVFFQVRPLADAFYDSEIEPWSAMITSEQGRDPGYDVLKFLIDETHSRGMQFHAWMNPYRIAKRDGPQEDFPPLDPKIPVELTKDYAKCRIYNPALPEVRERIALIIKDLVSRYDVDGVHFDDYFYPSLQKDEPMNDELEFETFREDEASIEEFRHHNVERMVALARDAVKQTDSTVIFSISPAGNYEYCCNSMYFDIEDICRKGLIDMIIPQLYWSTAAPTDYFTPRLEWFSQHTADVPMLVGYAIYRFGTRDKGFETADDFLKEYRLARSCDKVRGGVMFRAADLLQNRAGIVDSIATAYREPVRLARILTENTSN
jgi:uncharacterized lipoprotein YddW (UPF0748 family)